MISAEKAHQLIEQHAILLPVEKIPFDQSLGRISAEPILADRDLPPFNRVTMDGIALNTAHFDFSNLQGKIEALRAAGEPQYTLQDPSKVVEIMTGSPLPINTDAVVMYEQLTKVGDTIQLKQQVKPNQNIHPQGKDAKKGQVLLDEGRVIGPAELGLLAAVGKTQLEVVRWPKIALLATGNELVAPHERPGAQQIRVSNVYSLQAALKQLGIPSTVHQLQDDAEQLKKNLKQLLESHDVLISSGGVSKGRFDFLPGILPELGIQKVFHRVAQKPGKPLWFGANAQGSKVVFALPGNPASTFANFLLYVVPWLRTSLGLKAQNKLMTLGEPLDNPTDLTRYLRVYLKTTNGRELAFLRQDNGSGDLVSLAQADGLISLSPGQSAGAGEFVPYCAIRPLL
jgi:molybdopterin molybdotransferase